MQTGHNPSRAPRRKKKMSSVETKRKMDMILDALEKGDKTNLARMIANPGLLLYVAAVGNYPFIVKTLLENGANVNSTNTAGKTPLYLAAVNAHADTVRALLACPQLKPNENEPVQECTPLHAAVVKGHVEIARLLLEHPAVDANKPTRDGKTPLYLAALSGHVDTVRTLLACPRVKPNQNEPVQECTPLHAAVVKGHVEISRLLLEHPAVDANKPTRDGKTPLYVAAERGYVLIARCLLDRSADVNAANIRETTPLHAAARRVDVAMVSVLLEFEANVHADCPRLIQAEATPLAIAKARGNPEMLEMMRNHRSDFEIVKEGLKEFERKELTKLTERKDARIQLLEEVEQTEATRCKIKQVNDEFKSDVESCIAYFDNEIEREACKKKREDDARESIVSEDDMSEGED